MDSINIAVFVGKSLETYGIINPIMVQKYIYRDKDVGKALPLEEIQFVLDMLVTGGFIEIVGGNHDLCEYVRYISEKEKKEIIKNEKQIFSRDFNNYDHIPVGSGDL